MKDRANKLNELETKLKFGFMFKEYKNSFYYWEFVKIYEKIIIIIFLNYYS